MITNAQRSAALGVMVAIAETLRELGEVPSGHFCARLQAMPLLSQMTADHYAQMIGSLKAAGLVRESNYLLTWIEPMKGERQ